MMCSSQGAATPRCVRRLPRAQPARASCSSSRRRSRCACGNSRHTRNLRCMHDGPSPPMTGSYPEERYWQDLLDVTGGRTNEALARMVITGTDRCRDWMTSHGVRFPAVARGRAAPVAYERVLPGRWEVAGQRLLSDGRASRRRDRVRGRGARPEHRERPIRRGGRDAPGARGACPGPKRRGGVGGLPSQPRLAQGGVGRGGRQLSHTRDAVRHGSRAAIAYGRWRQDDGRPNPVPRRGDRRARPPASTAAL